jgi:hypothetical protein
MSLVTTFGSLWWTNLGDVNHSDRAGTRTQANNINITNDTNRTDNTTYTIIAIILSW